ncbi:MAG: hypothetical protein MUP36_03355, partial [Demequinaceae bacterium]|nr:hypothetical protein [Demequinaceae bacterium]
MASKRLVERPGNTIEELAEVIEGRARTGRKVAVWMGLIGLVAGVGLTSAGYAYANAQDQGSDRVEVDLTTVAVERRDVSLYTEFAGSLGYESSVTVTTRGSGIITSIASEGSDRDRGDILYTLDSEPVVLLYGDLPAWRTLSTSSENGPDILQLETNLAALGYTASGNMTVDEDFTYNTGVALKAWETDVGMSDPGRTFDPGQVVYLPGEIRVDTAVTRGTVASEGIEVLTAAVIDEVTDEVVGDHSVSSSHRPTQAVTLTVTTSDQSMFFAGLDVDIVLADDT